MAITVDNYAIGVGYFKVNAVDMGSTKGGVEVRREITWYDFDCDQIGVIGKKSPTMVRMYVNTAFAEPTLANMRYAWSIPTSLLISSSITFTDATDVAAANALDFKTGAPAGKIWNWTYTKAVSLGTGRARATRTEGLVVPVEFECIATITGTPPTASFGQVLEAAS